MILRQTSKDSAKGSSVNIVFRLALFCRLEKVPRAAGKGNKALFGILSLRTSPPFYSTHSRTENRFVRSSVKLKSQEGTDRSIAHFYRHIELYPYLNPAIILAPAMKPLEAFTSKSLFMGGNGLVKLFASIHRSNWVAGQSCYVNLRVENDSTKKVSFFLIFVRNADAGHCARSKRSICPSFERLPPIDSLLTLPNKEVSKSIPKSTHRKR